MSKKMHFWLNAPGVNELNILSRTKLTVKQQDFALPCNINNFGDIKSGGG